MTTQTTFQNHGNNAYMFIHVTIKLLYPEKAINNYVKLNSCTPITSKT